MARTKGSSGLTPSKAKRMVGVAKVVVPVVAPFAVQAISSARDAYERMRARRLGVDVEDLPTFSGKGAALHARIAGIANVLTEVRSRAENGNSNNTDADTMRFITDSESRLRMLTGAVRTAERMPPARRRAAHKAVAGQLNKIEDELLRRLGVQPNGR